MIVRNTQFTCSLMEIGNIQDAYYPKEAKQGVIKGADTLVAEFEEAIEVAGIRAKRFFEKWYLGSREMTVFCNINVHRVDRPEAIINANVVEALKSLGFRSVNKYDGFHGWVCETWMKTVKLQ